MFTEKFFMFLRFIVHHFKLFFVILREVWGNFFSGS